MGLGHGFVSHLIRRRDDVERRGLVHGTKTRLCSVHSIELISS